MSDKLTTFTRPRPAEPRPVDPIADRFVYDDNAKSIGGKPVVMNKDNLPVVKMSDAEAQFFLDQGAIGNKPFPRLSAKAANVIEQATGTSEPAKGHKKA